MRYRNILYSYLIIFCLFLWFNSHLNNKLQQFNYHKTQPSLKKAQNQWIYLFILILSLYFIAFKYSVCDDINVSKDLHVLTSFGTLLYLCRDRPLHKMTVSDNSVIGKFPKRNFKMFTLLGQNFFVSIFMICSGCTFFYWDLIVLQRKNISVILLKVMWRSRINM